MGLLEHMMFMNLRRAEAIGNKQDVELATDLFNIAMAHFGRGSTAEIEENPEFNAINTKWAKRLDRYIHIRQ